MSERRTLRRTNDKKTGLSHPDNRKHWWAVLGVYQHLYSSFTHTASDGSSGPVDASRRKIAIEIRKEREHASGYRISEDPRRYRRTLFWDEWFKEKRAEWVVREHQKRLQGLE